MDPIQRNQSLFNQIDIEISEFIEIFSHDADESSTSLHKLMQTSRTIGGSLYKDCSLLQQEFNKTPLDRDQVIAIALRIKQELKEL